LPGAENQLGDRPVPGFTAETAERICAEVSRRWRQADPLLPAAANPPAACGSELVVGSRGLEPAAIGFCEHWVGAPDELELSWGARRRFRLTPRVAGPDLAGSLDRLLDRWRAHLGELPEAQEDDTAAVVLWPSRDIGGVAALLRRGFAPRDVITARVTGSPPPRPVLPPISIRRADRADLEAVVALGLEIVRYDEHFGGVIERPGTADALRREVRDALAGPQPWTWLAERDGQVVGMLHAERPESTGWIAPLVRLDPVAYLTLMVVLPSERARGLGAALAAEYHAEVDAVGAAVSLLHYSQTNPLSVPFWSQQGYRPLWTSWEVRPAGAIR
jgi:GNAT superfamily N-acetyltransferase